MPHHRNAGIEGAPGRTDGWQGRRDGMVSRLSAEDACSERLLAVFARLPRHRFVDPGLSEAAYKLDSLPIGSGQTISSAATQARMTELLDPRSRNRILEVGTGSGYQTALLAELSAWVFTIEVIEALAARAKDLLGTLGYRNVLFRTGDGAIGWREAAPFDRILVTAGAPRLPDGLLSQLADGGRLVCPVGQADRQELVVIERSGDRFSSKTNDTCRFVPLIGAEGWPCP
ncbi:MAG: protein-L-isoaspartate O-methyltransferase [Gemmatimonadetes bacterium]|nr:protein-L-isoaspartate O-methyltransferase [Gemmatimonadota bacterium]